MKKTEKIYKIIFNGKLFMHSVKMEEAKAFFQKMVNKSSYMGDYSKVSTSFGEWEVVEDEWVLYASDTVSTDDGMADHVIITNLEGKVIYNQKAGDWVSPSPCAYGVTPVLVSRASVHRELSCVIAE